MPGDFLWLWIAWGVCLALAAVGTIYGIRTRKGVPPPAPDATPILFRENLGSGRSLGSNVPAFGASNCLQITVTPDELRTTLTFPFGLFGDGYDLEHQIPKRDTVSVEEVQGRLTGRRIVVVYKKKSGRVARLELDPKWYEEFRVALAVGMKTPVQ